MPAPNTSIEKYLEKRAVYSLLDGAWKKEKMKFDFFQFSCLASTWISLSADAVIISDKDVHTYLDSQLTQRTLLKVVLKFFLFKLARYSHCSKFK